MSQHKPLSPRERAFVREYLACSVGKTAAERAGYPISRAKQQACLLLKKPEIKAAIAATEATRDQTAIMAADDLRVFWTATIRNAALPLSERLKASDLLGKSQGCFVERKITEGSTQQTITLDLIPTDDLKIALAILAQAEPK
jgi:phage terminase small subunit